MNYYDVCSVKALSHLQSQRLEKLTLIFGLRILSKLLSFVSQNMGWRLLEPPL